MRNNKIPYVQPLVYSGTKNTPKVCLDAKNEQFFIEGKSVPDNAPEFYCQLLNWFDDYLCNPNGETVLHIYLEYFNTPTSRYLLLLLYKLNDMNQDEQKVQVKWYYFEDDLDMLEAGKDYEFMVRVPFEFISVKNDQLQLAS